MQEFTQKIFKNIECLEDILTAGKIGLWAILFNPNTNNGQLLCNKTVLESLGLKEQPDPKDCYRYWLHHIEKSSIPRIVNGFGQIIMGRRYHEIEYIWNHPDRGYLFLRIGITLMKSYTTNDQIGFIGHYQDITELAKVRQQLRVNLAKLEKVSKINSQLLQQNESYKTLAYIDMLTGLPNRRAFFEYGRNLLESLLPNEASSVIMADIDHFKVINDTYTHPRGDDVLREVARRLQTTLRQNEVCARIGGEEFAILLPCDLELSGKIAERLRAVCANKPVTTVAGDITVTLSFGVADIRSNVSILSSMQEGLQRADKALYHAKESGRNRVCLDGEF